MNWFKIHDSFRTNKRLFGGVSKKEDKALCETEDEPQICETLGYHFFLFVGSQTLNFDIIMFFYIDW